MKRAIEVSFIKIFTRWSRRLWFSKRQQFVIVTIILTALLLLTQLVAQELRYPMVILLSAVSYGLSAFALREDLHGIEWGTLLVLPTLFTTAVSMFYFLLPVRWLTRLPVAFLYGIGMYALLLTENIYNVAFDRTIALLRAAHSVGFLLTLLTYFFLVQTVLAFRFSAPINAFIIGIVSFGLILSALWAMELTEAVSGRVWQLSVSITLFLVNLVWIFSFLPTKSTMVAILFTTAFYSSVGMGQQYLVEKLYKKNVIEFGVVAAIVFIMTILSTSWRGNG
jgi:hypothetical protein